MKWGGRVSCNAQSLRGGGDRSTAPKVGSFDFILRVASPKSGEGFPWGIPRSDLQFRHMSSSVPFYLVRCISQPSSSPAVA